MVSNSRYAVLELHTDMDADVACASVGSNIASLLSDAERISVSNVVLRSSLGFHS
jgi:hypothetical protein